MVQVDLRCKMMEKRATDTDDIQAHLDDMALMHEHLSGIGIALHDDDYALMILMSLPESYMIHLETLANAAGSSRNPLMAHSLIIKAVDLYEKCQLHTGNDTKSAGKDTAFHTSDLKAKGRKNRQKSKKDVECYNCHKMGHFSCDCYRPGGGKEGQGPHSKKGGQQSKDNAANSTSEAPNGAWLAILAGASPNLTITTHKDNDTTWRRWTNYPALMRQPPHSNPTMCLRPLTLPAFPSKPPQHTPTPQSCMILGPPAT